MGHREDLLEGAKRCLYEKGYARTTARDIVAVSGANLGSIGYHFGSKEALLNAALVEAMRDMGREFTRVSSQDLAKLDWDELATGWTRVFAAFNEHRPLLVSQTEAWAQAERSEELRAQLAEHYRDEISHGAALTRQYYNTPDEHTAWAVSALITAIADGLVLQWLIDPDHALTGRDVADGLRAIASAVNRPDSDADENTQTTI